MTDTSTNPELESHLHGQGETVAAGVSDRALEKACRAFSEAYAVYPDGTAKTQIVDWFELDAQDAVDFGALSTPEWHGYSDIRAMQFEAYVAAVIKEPMRAALEAARLSSIDTAGPAGDWHGVETAPVSCTVLATHFDHEAGEWIVEIVVAERAKSPHTHWKFIDTPDDASGEAEPVAWRWRFEDQEVWTVQKRKPHWYTPDQSDIVMEPLYALARQGGLK